ncbi:uncharacterized protein LOC143617926, partial [Bidens hawaiensis]|uniref:uncharacterized protein LOC143617926 n=1 Tax=Bidens hawaiensis TaxID=980011 RepID=UPI00404A0AAB
VNQTAKLKQCKLDVRLRTVAFSRTRVLRRKTEGVGVRNRLLRTCRPVTEGENRGMAKLVINNPCGGEENHYSDWESPSNSPTSHTSSLTSNRSVMNFTGGSSSRSSSSSSGGCYSESMTEEDDGDDGCLDDWEAIADALAADEIKTDHNANLEPEIRNLEPVETMKDEIKTEHNVNHRAWSLIASQNIRVC